VVLAVVVPVPSARPLFSGIAASIPLITRRSATGPSVARSVCGAFSFPFSLIAILKSLEVRFAGFFTIRPIRTKIESG
jgi:hypothetical protein